MRTTKPSLAVLALVALTSAAAPAQSNTGTITATTTVEPVPISVQGIQNLDFGTTTPGISKTVSVFDGPPVGRFDVFGQPFFLVSLTFVLPTELTSGSNTLPIGSWTGAHNNVGPTPLVIFTPSGSAELAALGSSGQLFVFIGATVSPSFLQPAGTYTGTVSMTVVY